MLDDQEYFTADYAPIVVTDSKTRKKPIEEKSEQKNIGNQTVSISADLRKEADQTNVIPDQEKTDIIDSLDPKYAIRPESAVYGIRKPTRKVIRVQEIHD